MRDKETRRDIRPMPEVELPGLCGRMIHYIFHIHPFIWLAVTAVAFALFVIVAPHAIWLKLWKIIVARKFYVTLLTVFTLLAVSLVWAVGQKIDVWVFTLFNSRGQRPQWLDWVMITFTQAGNGVFAYIVAGVVFLRIQHMLAYELMFGTLTLWLAVELMKILIRRARPYSALTGARVVGERAGGHSFPSGHTSQAFFMASLFAHYLQGGIAVAVILYGIAILVGVTRMYVGMHYPRDVIGGAILGTAWGLFGVIINSYIFLQLHLH